MKEKLNNALNELDERLIQEAAEADRLESSAPKIMRRILIPAGAVAAAGLCVFGLSNLPRGGVDLVDSSPAGSIPAAVLPEQSDILPEVMELHAPSREYAEETIFGSEFPYIIYAGSEQVAFTDIGQSIYVYDRAQEKIIYSANVYDVLREYTGDRYKEFGAESWNGVSFGALVRGEETLYSVTYTRDETNYRYIIDMKDGVMRRYEQLDEGCAEFQPERSANFGGSIQDVVIVNDSEYVGIGIDAAGFNLRNVEITDYTVKDGLIEATDTAKPFDDRYFGSLEMADENLGVYKLSAYADLRFDVSDCTFTLGSPYYTEDKTAGRCFIDDSELVLLCDSGEEFRFTISGDSVIAVTGEQEAELCRLIWQDGVPPVDVLKLEFSYAYGEDIKALADSIMNEALSSEYDREKEFAEQQALMEEINQTQLEKMETMITGKIKYYQEENGITVDSDKIFDLINSMTYPLDSDLKKITTYNGYDEWRGGTHYGIDIGDVGIKGTWVTAPLPGTVVEANSDGWNKGFGNYVIIDHGSGLSTVYAHLDEVHYIAGQSVAQGSVIGTVGSTGWSTGPHLHFEIRVDGEVSSELMDLFTARFAPSVKVSFNESDGTGGGFADLGTDDLSRYTSGTFTVEGNQINCVFADGSTYSFTTSDEYLLKADAIRGTADNGSEQAEVILTRAEQEVEVNTKSIYDPGNAAQLIESLTCPVAEEYNVVTETPGSYYGHKGIDFQTADIFGQDILAAQSGEVILAEWYYGYGNCIMIDHGSGVMTVYAHCDELNVTAGQTVRQGEVIGKVGQTGQTDGGRLHFEIRCDNEPDADAMNEFMERIGSVRSNTKGITE